MVLDGDAIDRARIVVNGVAARPLRLPAVEQLVAGRPRDEATAAAAGERAVEGALPLRHNGYKVPLMRNLVKRAIRGVPEATWTS
jgi:xanthine dehydrogenase YagS FAD-binding subunit